MERIAVHTHQEMALSKSKINFVRKTEYDPWLQIQQINRRFKQNNVSWITLYLEKDEAK